jgi:AraC-like DNA-binding protein
MAETDVSAPGRPEVLRFSTDSFREHERVAAWREAFGRTLLNIDLAPENTEGFRASAAMWRLGPLGLMRASTSAVRQWNTRNLITNDDVSFGSILNGRWRGTQFGRDAELSPGDGLLLSNGDVGALTLPDECRFLTFVLPKAALAPLVPDIGALFSRPVPAANPALRMLQRYLEFAYEDQSEIATPELQTVFADHVCDLLAITLGATRDAAEQATSRGIPAARLRAMKDDIRKLYRQPDLSVQVIAARHGVSVRYVQKIFEESGCTFTRYVTEQRLAAAHKALRRRRAGVPIGTIAYACGFTDVSHFNRLFRQHFGRTPSDIRGEPSGQ